MALRRTKLIYSKVHVTDDFLEPRCGNASSLDLEGGDVAEVADRIETSQRSNVDKGNFAEGDVEALVYVDVRE